MTSCLLLETIHGHKVNFFSFLRMFICLLNFSVNRICNKYWKSDMQFKPSDHCQHRSSYLSWRFNLLSLQWLCLVNGGRERVRGRLGWLRTLVTHLVVHSLITSVMAEMFKSLSTFELVMCHGAVVISLLCNLGMLEEVTVPNNWIQ